MPRGRLAKHKHADPGLRHRTDVKLVQASVCFCGLVSTMSSIADCEKKIAASVLHGVQERERVSEGS